MAAENSIVVLIGLAFVILGILQYTVSWMKNLDKERQALFDEAEGYRRELADSKASNMILTYKVEELTRVIEKLEAEIRALKEQLKAVS